MPADHPPGTHEQRDDAERIAIAFEQIKRATVHVADESNPRILAFRSWLLDEIDDFRREVTRSLHIDLDRPATMTKLE